MTMYGSRMGKGQISALAKTQGFCTGFRPQVSDAVKASVPGKVERVKAPRVKAEPTDISPRMADLNRRRGVDTKGSEPSNHQLGFAYRAIADGSATEPVHDWIGLWTGVAKLQQKGHGSTAEGQPAPAIVRSLRARNNGKKGSWAAFSR